MFGNMHQAPAPGSQLCGLYYIANVPDRQVFLPQVNLEAHAVILSNTSRTTLVQTFINPSSAKGIREVKYVFPLYDGVSVVGFTCHVDDRTIVGEVKEKNDAKHDYSAAVARGETAGLFEQLHAADTFLTTVGNVPPGSRIVVKITYLGELKHDMEVDGIRFTIPNIIAPRYGTTPLGYDYDSAEHASRGSISVIVDVEMAEGSFIQKVLSPSHAIAVSIGTLSTAPNDEPRMTKASATLSIGSTRLDNDFILQIVAKDTGVPKAILESHPTIPNQRALMVTLVPKFALPPQNPEIVFVCDRSGSMAGSSITLVKQALQVFLKSLPVGVMFNICSFGSSYSFLWPKSVSYSQQTLEQAVAHVNTLTANYGGTEMLQPLKATIEQRYKDIPLEVMMLTDGEIWGQEAMFTYLNQQVKETKVPIRVYSLGIGSSVSHSLVEGLARAGNGFSQIVGEGEKMDSKIVRMLKGALSPHVDDYTLEVKYSSKMENTEEEDDFEMIEKVADSLTVKLDLNEKTEKPEPTKPISLFDPSVDPDKLGASSSDNTGESRFAHLPKVPLPKIIQAPQSVPPLFSFIRTAVYLLLGPDAPTQTPTSVILRGTSTHGPLELEFPVHILDTPGQTIHQLAAKKAMSELEEGRGWLPEARDESGKLLKDQYESRFSSMVEREAVRLGVQFQVSGKWCSFVAVEKNKETPHERQDDKEWEYLDDDDLTGDVSQDKSLDRLQDGGSSAARRHVRLLGPGTSLSSVSNGQRSQTPGSIWYGAPTSSPRLSSYGPQYACCPPPGPFFGQSAPQHATASHGGLFGAPTTVSGAIRPPTTRGLFGAASSGLKGSQSLFGQPAQQHTPTSTGTLFGWLNTSHAPNKPPTTGLFGASRSGLFGATSSGPKGSQAPFGQSGPQHATPSTGGLFGSLNTSHAASGQPITGLFGTASSGPKGSQSLFGQPTQQHVQQQHVQQQHPQQQHAPTSTGGLFGPLNTSHVPSGAPATGGGLFGSATLSSSMAGTPPQPRAAQGFGSSSTTTAQGGAMLFGHSSGPASSAQPQNPFRRMGSASFDPGNSNAPGAPSAPSLFSSLGGSSAAPAPAAGGASLFASPMCNQASTQTSNPSRLFGFGSASSTQPATAARNQLFTAPPPPPPPQAPPSHSPSPTLSTENPVVPQTDEDILTFLIQTQTFEGSWPWSSALFAALRIDEATAEKEMLDVGCAERAEWATLLV